LAPVFQGDDKGTPAFFAGHLATAELDLDPIARRTAWASGNGRLFIHGLPSRKNHILQIQVLKQATHPAGRREIAIIRS
jgi:hypothetical protein